MPCRSCDPKRPCGPGARPDRSVRQRSALVVGHCHARVGPRDRAAKKPWSAAGPPPGGLSSPDSHSTADARCRASFDLSIRVSPLCRERVPLGIRGLARSTNATRPHEPRRQERPPRNRPPATSMNPASASPRRPRPWTHVAFAPPNEYLILNVVPRRCA